MEGLIYLTAVLLFVFCFLMFTGKPIKIEITHKQVLPEVTEIEVPETKEAEEMSKNAENIMEKINREWSGVEYEDEI